jgi:hypothetical protein
MNQHANQSQATRSLAAAQSHHDVHPGGAVITSPTHDDIAGRAFDIYVKTGSKKGQCKQNWLQAEHELKTSNHRA